MDCEFKEIAERNGLQPAPNTPIVDEASFHAAILHSYIVTADGAIVTRTNPSSHTFISQPVSLEPFPSFDPDVVVTPPSPTTPHAEIGPDVIVTPPSPITSQAGLATDDDDDEAESYLEMAPKKTTNGKAAKKPKGKEKDDEVWGDPDALLGPTDSPLYNELTPNNFITILKHPRVTALLAEKNVDISTLLALPESELRKVIALFQEDGKNGFHDKEFLEQATAAGEKRKEGGV